MEEGILEGLLVNGVGLFKGIPFMEPPIGELRFRQARKKESWEGIKNAIDFGHICPQNDLTFLDFGNLT